MPGIYETLIVLFIVCPAGNDAIVLIFNVLLNRNSSFCDSCSFFQGASDVMYNKAIQEIWEAEKMNPGVRQD